MDWLASDLDSQSELELIYQVVEKKLITLLQQSEPITSNPPSLFAIKTALCLKKVNLYKLQDMEQYCEIIQKPLVLLVQH